MQRNLISLLDGISFEKAEGSFNKEIKNLSIDSKSCKPGTLFFALKGTNYNGLNYLEEAASRGAIAVVSEETIEGYNNLTKIQVKDAHYTLSKIANRFYLEPDKSLKLIGITGTNGKTTVSWLTKYLLDKLNYKSGYVGTLAYDVVETSFQATRTTPNAILLNNLLSEMLKNGCKYATIEASSHGIDQHRVSSLEFNTCAFLNLSPEHLDYHGNLKNYFHTKQKIFSEKIKHSIINLDDHYGLKLAKKFNVISFGIKNQSAIIKAKNIEYSLKGTCFDLVLKNKNFKVKTKLIGEHNVYNCLAALSIIFAQNLDLEQAIEHLSKFEYIPGRLEKITKDYNVFIDYAHTPHALEQVLKSLRPLTKGKLHLIFGCGGNRDTSKRPLMAKVAESYSSNCIVTSDNPRWEDDEKIFSDIRKGFENPQNVKFIKDRKKAIAEGLKILSEDDILLIAGKGHEKFQEIKGKLIELEDKKVVYNYLGIEF